MYEKKRWERRCIKLSDAYDFDKHDEPNHEEQNNDDVNILLKIHENRQIE